MSRFTMAEGETKPVQSTLPLRGCRVLPVLLVTLSISGVVGKVAGVHPFADSTWFEGTVWPLALTCLAVKYWRSARPATDASTAPEGAIHSGWLDHAMMGCFVTFFGIITVTAILMLLGVW